MGTIAAHKPCEFQEYWLRDSPLWGENVTKISDFGGFPVGDPQMDDLGQIWHAMPNMTPIGALVCRAEKQKNYFNSGSFLTVKN